MAYVHIPTSAAIKRSDTDTTFVFPIRAVRLAGFEIRGQIDITKPNDPTKPRTVRGDFQARVLPKDPDAEVPAIPYYSFYLRGIDKPFAKDARIGLKTNNYSRMTYYDFQNKPYPAKVAAMIEALHAYIHEFWEDICHQRIQSVNDDIQKIEAHLLRLQSFSEDIGFGEFPLVEETPEPFRVRVSSLHDEGEDWAWTITQAGNFIATEDGYSTSEEAIAAGEAHMAVLNAKGGQ